MVCFVNVNYESYLSKYRDKKIICIGAGGTCRDFIRQHMDKVDLLDNIVYLLDNNKGLQGSCLQVGKRILEIAYLPDFDECVEEDMYIIFLLLKDAFVCQVLEQLDKMTCFDGLDCIYGLGTFQWGYTFFPQPRNPHGIVLENRGKDRIPSILHYCWFGPKEIPKKDQVCIESWSRVQPDFTIMRWDESTYDISKTPKYVREAYAEGKYAFVSDYVRLDVVYRYGGFYLDVDVELLKDLNDFRSFRMVFAYMEYGEINTGLGFAGEAGCVELKEMMDMYERIPFCMADGSYNLTPCPRYTNDYFRRRGIYPDNYLEVVDDMLFLPSDYLCPMNAVLCEDGSYQLAQLALTDNSRAVHWCDNSWKDTMDRDIFEKEKKLREEVNQRLLHDWKRKERIG